MSRAMAKQMILEIGAARMPITAIASKCGMTQKEVNKIVQHMRNTGKLPRPPRRVLIAENDFETLSFSGPSHAEAEGFEISSVKRCISGERKTHAGYTWRYKVLE